MSWSLLPGMGALRGGLDTIHAAQVVTGTATTTAGPTPPLTTPTAAIATTPVVPPATIPPEQAPNPLSADYLGQAAQAGLGIFSTLFLLLSAILLGAGAYYYFVGKKRWYRVHKLNYRLANFWSLAAMSLGALGVLFTLFRVLGVEGLNLRFWLYLLLLAMIGFAIYAAIYFRGRYPGELAAFNKANRARPANPQRAKAATPRPTAAGAPVRPPGSPGNPRGTSPRGERRREKKR